MPGPINKNENETISMSEVESILSKKILTFHEVEAIILFLKHQKTLSNEIRREIFKILLSKVAKEINRDIIFQLIKNANSLLLDNHMHVNMNDFIGFLSNTNFKSGYKLNNKNIASILFLIIRHNRVYENKVNKSSLEILFNNEERCVPLDDRNREMFNNAI